VEESASHGTGGKAQSGFWLYYVLFGAVVVRAFVYSMGEGSFAPLPYALMGAFLLLSLIEPLLTRRVPVLVHPWLGVQSVIVFAMLLTRPLHDFYAMLFMSLCLPVTRTIAFGRDFLWLALFCILLTAGHLLGFGWPEGALYSPSFIAGVIFIGLYGRANRTTETARVRSDELARQLQDANHRLRVYAGQAEETATAQERARLARELHDAVTQTVFSMNLTAQAARMSLEREPRKTPALLDRLQELARDALSETRSMVDELRPHTIAEMGLVSALERHFALRERRDALSVSFTTEGRETGSPALADALFRTTQEALNNVVRHSGTLAATVRLTFAGDCALLSISDTGRGFDTAGPRRAESFGLLTMRERVEALGGSFRLSSTPGAGTDIEVRVPMDRGQGDEKQEA
jgi:signal transduction histidine kinase